MMSMMSQILKKHFIKSGMGYSKWECIRGEWNGSSLFWMEWVIHSMHGRGVWIEMRSPPLPLPLCSSSLALMTKMMMCRTHPSQAHGCKWAAYLMQEMFNNAGSLGLTVPCHNAGLSGYYQAPSVHLPNLLTPIIINYPSLLKLFIISINEFFLLQQIFPSCSYLECKVDSS